MSNVFEINVDGEIWKANCGWRHEYNIWTPKGERYSVLRKDVKREESLELTIVNYIKKEIK